MSWRDRVNEHMTIDEVVQRYPNLKPFLEELGARDSCRDCALAALAHRLRMQPQDLVARVNEQLWKGEVRG